MARFAESRCNRRCEPGSEEIHAATVRHESCRVFRCAVRSIWMNRNCWMGRGCLFRVRHSVARRLRSTRCRNCPTRTAICFSPCGASAIYERDLFLEIGGFDERFFCYCEDVDLGMRLQLSDEKCVFPPRRSDPPQRQCDERALQLFHHVSWV